MKLTRTLNALLLVQIAMFAWTIQILYSASHDGVSDFAGLGALVPIAAMYLLGAINIVLLLVHFYKVTYNKAQINLLAVILVMTNILLILSFDTLEKWASSGPG